MIGTLISACGAIFAILYWGSRRHWQLRSGWDGAALVLTVFTLMAAGLLYDTAGYLSGPEETLQVTSEPVSSAAPAAEPEPVQSEEASGLLDPSPSSAGEDSDGSETPEASAAEPIIYRLSDSDLVAPAPDPDCFGETTDPAEIQAIIESAKELMGDQTTIWNPDIVLYPGHPVYYYADSTILVLSWTEEIEGMYCTCTEVKIADGSQLRRRLAGDTYGSGVRDLCSRMADGVNAVVATNGDFYSYRQIGITVWQGELYRAQGGSVDTCFFDADGNMWMKYAGEFSGEEEMRQFILDNGIRFSASFGPILVDKGEIITPGRYPIGETFKQYSRAAIGMTGERHYFLLNINAGDRNTDTATVLQEAQIMADKGCVSAYALDGGQTAETYMNGTVLNGIDWNSERHVSDILYFATAVPD